MKRILLIMTAALAFCFSSVAADFRTATPEETDAVLSAFDRVSTESRRFICDFVQTRHTALLEKDIVSKGRLTMDAPDSLVWAYSSPEKKSYAVDLTADSRFVAMGRKQDFSREVLIGSDGTSRIVLRPLKRDLKKLFSVVEVDMKSGRFSKVRMTELTGDYTLIEFGNVSER